MIPDQANFTLEEVIKLLKYQHIATRKAIRNSKPLIDCDFSEKVHVFEIVRAIDHLTFQEVRIDQAEYVFRLKPEQADTKVHLQSSVEPSKTICGISVKPEGYWKGKISVTNVHAAATCSNCLRALERLSRKARA